MVLDHIENCRGPYVLLPTDNLIASTEKGQLSLLTAFLKAAKTAMILPQLASSSLLSLGKLCDDNFAIPFDKKRLIYF